MTPPDDPALTGNFSERWAQHIAANDARPLPRTGSKVSPAAALRKRCKEAIKSMAALGSKPLWEPRLTAGKVKVGKMDRAISVGNVGQTDVIMTWFSVAWHVELKAGSDRERPSQTEYKPRIAAAHGIRIEVRDPKDLIDAMMRWYETHPGTVAEAKRG